MIELARETLNPDLEWLGVVLNIADMRTKHSREAFESLRTHFGDKLIETTIRASIAYAESAERAVSILDYRPDLGDRLPEGRRRAARAAGHGRSAQAPRGPARFVTSREALLGQLNDAVRREQRAAQLSTTPPISCSESTRPTDAASTSSPSTVRSAPESWPARHG